LLVIETIGITWMTPRCSADDAWNYYRDIGFIDLFLNEICIKIHKRNYGASF